MKTKRILSFVLSLCMLLTLAQFPVMAATTGTCGDNLTWVLDDNGTLTISGTGDMTSWKYTSNIPWYNNRSNIKTVVIEEGVTSIGSYAFEDCRSLTSASVPEGLETIGKRAFRGCSSLTSIKIPNSVTSIGSQAFLNCSSLKAVHITDLSAWYEIDFYDSYSNPLYYAKNLYLDEELVTELVIPNDITSIGDYAFYNCDSLTNISIPSSVTSIGQYAFYMCSSLKAVHITDLSAWCEIDFYDASSNPLIYAKNLYLDGKLVTELVIPDGVTSIGDYAFYNCYGLTSISIPSSVTNIGRNAFVYCSGLQAVYITDVGAWYEIDFYDYYSNPLIYAKNLYLDGKLVTELVIPDGVASIGDYAFCGCSSLTSINIPESVTSIGQSAFRGCSSLTSVNLPEQLTSISTSLFFGCSSLTSIEIPEGVTSIGGYAFQDCTSLTSIEIPEGVTSIGDEAFRNCSSLTSVEIPEGVTSIGDEAFYECGSLTTVILGNDVKSIGNSAFEYCSSLTSIKIPDDVTIIGDSTFSNCFSLANVTLGKGVTSVGDSAFQFCLSLTSIEIPEGVTSIGDYAFYYCNSLTDVYYGGTKSQKEAISIGEYNVPLTNATWHFSCEKNGHVYDDASDVDCNICGAVRITVPEGLVYSIKNGEVTITDYTGSAAELVIPPTIEGYPVTSIGGSAFYNCTSLTSVKIPDSVTSIGGSAFYNCTSLTSINIPEGVTNIGNYTFYNCSALTSINIPEGVTNIGNYTFYNCSALTSIEIPEGLETIGDYAFYACEGLTSIEIPNSVTSIGSQAFIDCDRLQAVYITDVGAWCEIDFYYASSNPLYYANNLYLDEELVTELVIPDGVTSIKRSAFSGCTSLTSVKIPDSVTSMGNSVFYGCSSLTSIEIPEGVTNIGNYTFYNCSALTNIDIPDGVTRIGDYAFSYCSSLTSIDIPEGVTSIGDEAFRNCSSLTSIEIPEGLETIGDYAFHACEGITSIEIPNSVTSIGISAFRNCSSLTSIEIPEGVTSISNSAFRNCTSLTSINIPEGVTNIGNYTFYNCSALTSIEIPEGLETIGDYAFYACEGLTSIEIPEGVTSIGDEAFRNCSSLTSIEIPEGLETIGDYAFYACEGLTSIEIPNSVTSIGNYAFVRCVSLKSVKLPEGLETIGGYAFSGCSSLTSVKLPEGLKTIGDWAFYNCSSLTNIEIPDGVTSIGEYAFFACKGLTSIEIPEGVTSIGDYAFYYCNSLTDVYYGGTKSQKEAISIGEYNVPLTNATWHFSCEKNGHVYDDASDIDCNNCGAERTILPEGLEYIIENDEVTITYYTGSATELIIPSTIEGYPVTKIDDLAFYKQLYESSSIMSIELPEGIKTIGEWAFSGCTSLISINIPSSVTSIGYEAFDGCTSLQAVYITDIQAWCNIYFETAGSNPICYSTIFYLNGEPKTELVIPNGVTNIGDYAFFGCSSLTSIEIPYGVTNIGYAAFGYCSGVTSIEIPNSVKSIGSSVFDGCTNLEVIDIPNSVTTLGDIVFTDCVNPKVVKIPDSVTSMGTVLFAGCTGLESITLPGALTEIGENAFFGCTNLVSVTIGEGITTIGFEAFSGCSSLTSIDIPHSVTSIGIGAFVDCSKLVNISLPNSITTIDTGAFANCSSLTTIKLPERLTSISFNMFMGCSKLKDIEIPDSVTSIGGSAFYNCSSLTSITIPDSVTSIGFSAFEGCSSLTSIEIPDSVTNIGSSAFYDCSNLANVMLGNNITTIDYSAFKGCSSLTSISIPSSVTSIKYDAFKNCTSLKTVEISEGLSTLEAIFPGCISIETVFLPSTLTTIKYDAFCDSRSIKDVCYNGTKAQKAAITIGNSNGNLNTATWHYFDGTCDVECNDCGKTFSKQVSHSHVATETVLPTCESNGYTVYVCKWCGGDAREADYVVADGHKLDENHKCTVCGEQFTAPLKKYTIYITRSYITKKPIPGAKVTLNGKEMIADNQGMVVYQIEEELTNGTLEIEAEGYSSYIDERYYFSYYNTDTIALDSADYAFTSVWCNDFNVLVGEAQINAKAFALDADIEVKCKDNLRIERYEIVQGDTIIASNTNGEFKDISNMRFKPGEDVYVRVYTKRGEVTEVYEKKTNITVVGYQFDFEADLEKYLPFSFGLKFGLPDGTPGFSGTEINVPLKNNHKVSVTMSNTKVVVTVGFEREDTDVEKLDKKGIKAIFKDATDEWVKKEKSYSKNKKEIHSYVAFVIEYDKNGIKKAYGETGLGFNWNLNKGQTFMVGIVPMYAEFDLDFKGDLEITNIGYDFENTKWMIPELGVTLSLGITLYGGVGCPVVSAGVYGNLTGTISATIKSPVSFNYITISGELGLYAKARILFFKEVKYTLPLWQDSKTWWFDNAQTAAYRMYNMSSYTTSNREYLKERTDWLNISLMSNDANLVFLQDSTYDAIEPRIVTSGDTTMMFFLDDDGRDGLNYQHLFYSLYDETSGTWSNPQRVDANDNSDVEFDVYADESGIYVAYTELGDITDQDDYEKILGSTEVVTAEYDFANDEFVNHKALTSNDTFDTTPTIARTADGITVAWVNNLTNSIFAEDENGELMFAQNANNVVYFSTLTEGVWTEAEAITDRGAAVTSIDVGTLNGVTYVATICDNDCDYSTVDDRVLYLIDLDGNVTQVVNQQESNDGVQFVEMNGNDQLVWYNSSNLYTIKSVSDTPVAMFDYGVEGLTSNYKFLQVDSDTYAVLFAKNEVREDGEGNTVDGSNVYGVFYDNGKWGGAVPVTQNEPGYYVDAYDAFMNDGEVVIPYINAEVTITGTDINKRCSFLSTSFELKNDLVVGQAEYLPSQLFEGDKITLDVPVTNNSWQKLTSVSYAVLDSNGNTVLSGSLAKEIESGTTDYITFDLQKSLLITDEIYTIRVEADGWTENDITNNASTIDVWSSDFSIIASQFAFGDSQEIYYSITNEGNIADTATLKVYRQSDGTRIDIAEQPIASLNVGETLSGSLTVTDEYYSYGSDTGVVILEVVSDRDKIYHFNDSTSVTVGGIEYSPTTELDTTIEVVESPVIITPYVKYEKNSENLSVSVDEKGWTFVGVNELTTQDYSYNNGTLTLKKDYLTTLDKGRHSYTVIYSNSGKTTEVLLIVDKTYSAYKAATIVAENQTFKYDGNALKLGTDIIYSVDSQGAVSAQYSTNNGTSWTSGLPTKTGAYLIKLTVAQDDENEYLSADYTFMVSIEKGIRAISIPTITSTVDAQLHFGNSKLTAGKTDGTILYGYSLINDVSTVTQWSESGGTLPKVETPTSYYIFAKVVDGTNYEDAYSTGYAVDAHVHEYVSIIIPATKEQDGYTLHTCSTCKDEYKDNYQPYYIPGDVNGDGVVTNKDFGILRQYLNNWDVKINELAADVNRDGIVNNKDLGILRQYLNKWDVVLK